LRVLLVLRLLQPGACSQAGSGHLRGNEPLRACTWRALQLVSQLIQYHSKCNHAAYTSSWSWGCCRGGFTSLETPSQQEIKAERATKLRKRTRGCIPVRPGATNSCSLQACASGNRVSWASSARSPWSTLVASSGVPARLYSGGLVLAAGLMGSGWCIAGRMGGHSGD